MILERMKQVPHLVAIVDYVGEEPIYVVEPLQVVELPRKKKQRIALERHK